MKQLFVTTVLIAFYAFSYAQNETTKSIKNGTITYEQTIKMDIQLEGDAAEFAHMLPKERKTKKILSFNSEVSLYENIKNEEAEDISNMHEGGMIIKMEEPDQKIYTDLKTNKQTEQKEFMTRLFLIERNLDSKGWKITGKQMTVLAYNCQEAVKEEADKKIIAWFTSEIPIAAGPGQINCLPGIVLAVDINDGQQKLMAIEIKEGSVDGTILIKPTKGKKVTDEEFKVMVDEKMKEMGAEGEGEGKFIIKIKH